MAFSRDGRRLASASHDNTIKLWNIETRQELLTLKGHRNHIASVIFSPDGQTLATPGSGRIARLWRTAMAQGMAGLSTS